MFHKALFDGGNFLNGRFVRVHVLFRFVVFDFGLVFDLMLEVFGEFLLLSGGLVQFPLVFEVEFLGGKFDEFAFDGVVLVDLLGGREVALLTDSLEDVEAELRPGLSSSA